MENQNDTLGPVKKDSLYLKIADSIYRYIRNNELKPGDRLPSERSMAESLEISRNSLREALRLLEARGLLQVKTGKGVFLNNLYGEDSRLMVVIEGSSFAEIQELQTLLDCQAVRNATLKSSEAEKDSLIEIAEEMMTMAKNNIYSHTLDFSFHDLLYKMGKNSAIHQILTQIRDERFVYREKQEEENASIWLETIPQHLELAKAIKKNDEEKATVKMMEILEYGFTQKENQEIV